MKKIGTEDVVHGGWLWHQNDDGTMATDQIQTACLYDIAASLRQIKADIRSLGVDGIHDLIRLAVKRVRRQERSRKKKPARPRLRVA